MSALTPFSYAGHQVRVITIGGDPWFVASDVCAVLGIANPRDALSSLDDDEKGVATADTLGGEQRVSIVNEPGLYSLTLRSRKPEAKAFKRWVTHEVLPSIRKTGHYALASQITRRELAAMVIAESDRADAAEAKAAELEPAAHSWEQLASAEGDFSLRQAAQMLDRDPAISTGQNRLSRTLRDLGWTDARSMPYQRHVDAHRLVLRVTGPFVDGAGEERVAHQVRITAKGLHELHRLLGGERPLVLVATAGTAVAS